MYLPVFTEIALMFAIISAAYAWFLIKRLMHKGYSLLAINGTAMLAGGAMSILTMPLAQIALSSAVYDMTTFIWTTLALIFISNGIFYNLYGYLLRFYSLTFLSLAGFLSPIFGALYAWLIFGQQLHLSYLFAGIFIFIGLVLYYRQNNDYSSCSLKIYIRVYGML